VSKNTNSYDYPWMPEVYDLHETQTYDVEFIRQTLTEKHRQLRSGRPLRVFEAFCGTGRILLPLAQDGHEVVGMDQSEHMLERARQKLANLSDEMAQRVTLIQADSTSGRWPGDFDVVLLAGNCFYELATPAEQEGCIASAAAALRPGGHVWVDNDHMEGPLPESWTRPGMHKSKFPSGHLADGSMVETFSENLDCDVQGRIWRARRTLRVLLPDGRREEHTYLQQKHPVSFAEVEGWLTGHRFAIQATFGDHNGSPYRPDATRAIFWAWKHIPA
jgi:SAM-dependent methyltransferase